MAKIYLDSCISIYEVEAVYPWYVPVHIALQAYGTDEICVSNLTRLESRLGPIKANDPAGLANFDRFFASTTLLALDTDIYDLATNLRARHGLKTPDAIHLAAALHHGCAEFWTNDLRLAKATTALRFRVF